MNKLRSTKLQISTKIIINLGSKLICSLPYFISLHYLTQESHRDQELPRDMYQNMHTIRKISNTILVKRRHWADKLKHCHRMWHILKEILRIFLVMISMLIVIVWKTRSINLFQTRCNGLTMIAYDTNNATIKMERKIIREICRITRKYFQLQSPNHKFLVRSRNSNWQKRSLSWQ